MAVSLMTETLHTMGSGALSNDGRDVNILLVDDDARNLEVLESILSAPEYRLVRAQNADDALKALVEEDFALLVLDVRMPEMNGLELAQLIKQRKKTQHLPIIFLTAYYHEDEHVLQGYDVGAVDYLNKPCNPAVLRSKVAAFVSLYRINRALKNEIAERRQAELALSESKGEVQALVDQLRALATELIQTEERERKRLAAVLHDSVQQLLVSAKMRLAFLNREKDCEARQSTVDEVNALLSEALSISRSLTVELTPPVLQEAGLAAGLQWLAKEMADHHQFRVDCHFEPGAEPDSDEERRLLFECARELLFNAVKHAGVSEAELFLSRTDDERIQLIVDDRGFGFDLTKKRDATGESATFGLFTIQQRLVYLGGTIDIQSAPGSGTRIVLTSPVKRSNETFAQTADPQADDVGGIFQARDSATPISILVVDDHKIVRECLVGLLRMEPSIQVIGEAEDGPQAIDLAASLNPDVILMDMNLGAMNGLEATRIVLSRNPRIKVIGLSMHSEKHIADAMIKAGASRYLSKGVALEELLATIHECIGANGAAPAFATHSSPKTKRAAT
ncbi:MAG: response regulator [Candidatus Hydrogenedentes bacterium]|nr:response regulator [Candidatus Hydrogenedentota bacterium]